MREGLSSYLSLIPHTPIPPSSPSYENVSSKSLSPRLETCNKLECNFSGCVTRATEPHRGAQEIENITMRSPPKKLSGHKQPQHRTTDAETHESTGLPHAQVYHQNCGRAVPSAVICCAQRDRDEQRRKKRLDVGKKARRATNWQQQFTLRDIRCRRIRCVRSPGDGRKSRMSPSSSGKRTR